MLEICSVGGGPTLNIPLPEDIGERVRSRAQAETR